MSFEPSLRSSILIGITSYAGDYEQRLILKKVLRHLRHTNGHKIDVLLVSDGSICDPETRSLVDFLIDRPGPSGLQQGELDSIHEIVDFAKEQGYESLIKSSGDIIMTVPNWAEKVVERFHASGKKMLSTHWFKDNSWVVGTKFFACNVAFLDAVLPKTLDNKILEEALTQSIATRYSLPDVLYLINSGTGERNEVKAELKDWGWEHAHRLSKFVEIDAHQPFYTRCLARFLSQLLRIKRDITRAFR